MLSYRISRVGHRGITMGQQLTVRNLPDELQGMHFKLAQRIAQDPRQLTKAEKVALLAEIAQIPEEQISYRYLKALEDRADFQEALTRFRRSEVELTRGLVESMLPDAAAVRSAALREMRRRLDAEPELADLRLVPALTDPLLERAWPRKTDATVAAVAVNITLSPRQVELLDHPQYIVDAEIVDPTSDGEAAHDMAQR